MFSKIDTLRNNLYFLLPSLLKKQIPICILPIYFRCLITYVSVLRLKRTASFLYPFSVYRPEVTAFVSR